jgi:hypothetical protein
MEIVGRSLLETKRDKSGPMDLLLEMSLKPGGAETKRVPTMETTFEAAHALLCV